MGNVLAHPSWHKHVAGLGTDAIVILRTRGCSRYDVFLDRPSQLAPGQGDHERIVWLDDFDTHADALAFAKEESVMRGLPVFDLPTVGGAG